MEGSAECQLPMGPFLAVEMSLCLQWLGRREDVMETAFFFSDFAGLAGVKELPTQSMAAENKIHTAASYQFCLIKIVVTAGFKRQKSHQLPSAPLSHTEVDHS